MSVTLPLNDEIKTRLNAEAKRQGKTVEAVATQLIDTGLPISEKSRKAIAMLQQWAIEDGKLSDEDIARNRAVLQAIDDERPPGQKLFEEVLAEDSP